MKGMPMKKRSVYLLLVAVMVVAFCLILANVVMAAPTLPGEVYKPHGWVEVREAASFDARALTVLDHDREYRVAKYDWNPYGDNWAYIEYAPGRYGWVPVQVDTWIFGDVRYTVGVFWGQ